MIRITQLKIDLGNKDPGNVDNFYKELQELANDYGMLVMDDGSAPYTEDMTEQYKDLGVSLSHEDFESIKEIDS